MSSSAPALVGVSNIFLPITITITTTTKATNHFHSFMPVVIDFSTLTLQDQRFSTDTQYVRSSLQNLDLRLLSWLI